MSATMDAFSRLKVWLEHNGHKVERRSGRDFVRVERKRHGPMKIFLSLTRDGWRAAGDRTSHRSRSLETLVRDFNDAERVISGQEGDRIDAILRQRLDATSDLEVQQMADTYASQPPLTLSDIGREVRYATIRGGYVPYPTLYSLVVGMRHRDAYVGEPARRDALMGRAS